MSRISLIVLTFLVVLSCKKEPITVPPSSEGEPVFFTDTNLEGASTNWTAGFDNYYMHTRFDLDQNDIYTFIGTFAQEDCTSNCNESLQFEIRNDRQSTQENNLGRGTFVFKDESLPELDVYQIEMEVAHDFDEVKDVAWEFWNYDIFDKENVVYNFIDKGFNDPQEFFYSVKINNDNGDSVLISQKTFSLEKLESCNVDFSIEPLNETQLSLTPQIDCTNEIGLVLWDSEDVSLGNEPIVVDIAGTNKYSNGCAVFDILGEPLGALSRSVRTEGENIIYKKASTFHQNITKLPGGSLLQLGTFAIQYIDQNGVIYRSDRQAQPMESRMQIMAVRSYENNENGEKTLQLEVEYDCYVYSENGESIRLGNGNGTIAVAVPF